MLGSATGAKVETAVGIEGLEESVKTTGVTDTVRVRVRAVMLQRELIRERVQVAAHAVLWIREFGKREQDRRKTA